MAFFDASDLVESKYSMQHFREWAGEIANSYFGAAAALPTDTLTKIARTEELTPHQVEVLATETNKLIHSTKYAAVDEKYFAAEFPLADAKAALALLQLDGGGQAKVAAQFIDPILTDRGPTPFEMFGVQPEVMDKTASVKHQLKVAHEKAELLVSERAGRLMEMKTAHENSSHSFIKQARQLALDLESSKDRMELLGVLDHFVKIADLKPGKKLLAKLAYVLGKEGKLEPKHVKVAMSYFEKEADQKAPEELISKDLGATVVNGQHPLYITLKTIGDQEADLLRFEQEGLLVMDKVRILKQKIRAL